MNKKIAAVSNQCVACGVCIGVCPRQAIALPTGVRAMVDRVRCVGCGICVKQCPAQVITLFAPEGVQHG